MTGPSFPRAARTSDSKPSRSRPAEPEGDEVVSLPAPPEELRAARFDLAGDEYVVFSVPTREPLARGAASKLTDGEAHVARLLLGGASNRQIAAARGSALRTVANQVASIFRKLGVNSRVELALELQGGSAALRARLDAKTR